MSEYNVDCEAWPANDDIVPAGPQRDPNPEFFIRVTLEFTNGGNPSRIVRELFVPRREEGCAFTRDAWEMIRAVLTEMGIPRPAIWETILQITSCASDMVRDRENVGRRVFPIEVSVKCFLDEEEEEDEEDKEDKEEGEYEDEEEKEEEGEEMEEVVVERGEMCAVCLVVMEVGSVAMRLPCEHEFHAKCVRELFCHSRSCPVCRQALD